MALIKCIECGKEFSDRAAACPNCGCPTEDMLKEGKGEIAKADPTAEEFDILGRKFVLTQRLDVYIRLRQINREYRGNIEEKARSLYKSADTIDELIENLPGWAGEVMDSLLDLAVQMMVKSGVYSLDKAAFFQKYHDAYFNTDSIMSSLVERYVEILGYEAELKEYQEYVKAVNRSRWSGGGFGVSGAIKGSITAGLMNIGNGFLHALPEHMQKMNDERTIQEKKKRLLSESETYLTVRDSMTTICDGIFQCVIKELVESGILEQYAFDAQKAISILNNFNQASDSVGKDMEIRMLQQAFFADPSLYDVYFSILAMDYDRSGDVRKLAERFGYSTRVDKDLEELYERQISDLKEPFEEELYELESTAIADNETLFKVLDRYFKISREIDYMLEDEIMAVVTKRAGKGFTHSEVGAVKKYFHKYEHLLEEEFVENILNLAGQGERLKERRMGWKEKKEKWDSYADKCKWSVMYLPEVFEDALEGDEVAQEFLFDLLFKEIGEDEEDRQNWNRYCDFRNYYAIYRYEDDEPNIFEDVLDAIEFIINGNAEEGAALLEKSWRCPLSYYILSMVYTDEKKYLQKGAQAGSILAARTLVARTNAENAKEDKQRGLYGKSTYSIEKEQRCALDLGFPDFQELSQLTNLRAYVSYCGRSSHDGRYYYFYPLSYHAEKQEDLSGYIDEKDLIKNVDAYCTEQFLFYPEILKNGSVRYLMDTGNYPRDSACIPFLKPIDNDVPWLSYTLWDIHNTKSKDEIFLTTNGVFLWRKDGISSVDYKEYVPGCMDFESLIESFGYMRGHTGYSEFNIFIEEVIAVFRYACIKMNGIKEGIYVLLGEKEIKEALNPFAAIEEDEDFGEDLCAENEQSDKQIEQILALMKRNNFSEAYRQVQDIRKAQKEKGGNLQAVLSAITAAILRTARGTACKDWFQQYQKEVSALATHRSDDAIERAKNRMLLYAKGYKKPNPFIVMLFRAAALAGRHEAIKVMIKLCQQKALGAEESWADGWKEKLKIPDKKTDIFKMVEQIWRENGNPVQKPLDEILQPAKRIVLEKPYYNYDEINSSHHWKILLAYSKLFPIHSDRSIDGIYKGASLYEGGNTLAAQIRAYYGIPKEEVIFIMQDVSVFASKFKKGVIFTDKAIYFNNTSVDKIAWEDFSENDYSFGGALSLTYRLHGQKFEPPQIKTSNGNSVEVMIHLLPALVQNMSDAALNDEPLIKSCPQVDVKKCYPDEHFTALFGKKLQPSEYEYSLDVEYILIEDKVNKVASNTVVQNAILEQPNEVGRSGQQILNSAKEQAQNVSAVAGKIEQPKTTKYCAFCGKQIERTAKFCNYCGEATEEVNRYAEESKLVGYEFALSSKEIFSVTGRGVVVTGCISAGTVCVHDNVEVLHADGSSVFAVVDSIEKEGVRKLCDSATVGDNVGLLLSGVTRSQVECGDTIVKR